ncbi:hypothetical protein Taro_016633 [Colocasia esculenta]|uniref:Uncharacterized protein n=1 Tax=Colocasia esculenta TaxID=4460 RepID=A0A843UQV1_COLES|nr:hypothetical protein [Colocasia esculenta]
MIINTKSSEGKSKHKTSTTLESLKRLNITSKTSTGKSHKLQLNHNCANTRAHLELNKPRPRVTNTRTTTSSKARVGRERRHHTGTDYWLIRPISNPDNTTQEQPLSLAVTNERSNCRSTRKKSNNCGDQPTPHLQTHSCRPMPGTSKVSGRSTLK